MTRRPDHTAAGVPGQKGARTSRMLPAASPRPTVGVAATLTGQMNRDSAADAAAEAVVRVARSPATFRQWMRRLGR